MIFVPFGTNLFLFVPFCSFFCSKRNKFVPFLFFTKKCYLYGNDIHKKKYKICYHKKKGTKKLAVKIEK